jgi:tetratricopeptide (TPR) repeat protein
MAVEQRNAEVAGIVSEVDAAVRASDFPRALEISDAAIRRGIDDPALLFARGLGLAELEKHEEALADFRRLVVRFPQAPLLRAAMGKSQIKLGRLRPALESFDAAIAAAPDFALAHERKGLVLAMLGNPGAAQGAYRRAVELKPDFADALANLAMMATGGEEHSQIKSYAERALAADPGNATAIVALALLDVRLGEVAAGEAKLAIVLADPEFGNDPRAGLAVGVLGDALDDKDRTETAFAAYSASNEKRRAAYAERFAARRASDHVARLTAYFARSAVWKLEPERASSPDAAVGHVFLLGFARSGTTLLEAILGSRADTVVLDERYCFGDAVPKFLWSGDAGLDALAVLDDRELARWRGVYWAAVRQHGAEVAGKLFVDKNPLHTPSLPLIAKLFPRAKILLALRDPRDVVWSCFRHRFEVTPDSFEFLALADCARHYAAVMNLLEVYRRVLPIDLCVHRYEDMVDDFDMSVRAVCEFIDVPWNEAMRDFSEGTRSIDGRSVSARQIRRGLYKGAVGQWRKYRAQLGPVLPILAPWVERFGYPPE